MKHNYPDIKKIQEALVLAAIACLTISYFGGYYLIITTIGHHSTLLRETAVVLLFLKVLTTRYTKKEFAFVALLLALAFINYKVSGNTRALYSFLCLCALKNVDLTKVFCVSLVSLGAIIALMAVLSLTGAAGIVSVTEDFGRADLNSDLTKVETRYYLGYMHPNMWAQAMFSLMLLLVAVFYEKLDWKGILLLAALNYGIYVLSVSRTCFLSGIVLIILLVWSKYAKKVFEFPLIRAGILTGVSALWAIIFTIRADVENVWEWQIIDWKFFTGRIRQAQGYFQTFGLSIFGEKIPDKLDNGFILDMGYMRMLLENGVLIFVLMFLGTMILLIYAFRKKRNDIVVLTVCICMYGIYENQAIAQVPANLMVYYFANILYNESRKAERTGT